MADWLTRQQRSYNMSRIRASDTKPELSLRCGLYASGLRGWRNHHRSVAGASAADVAFTRWKVAIFVDGAFWHGHQSAFQFGKSGDYWDKKIRGNQLRDSQTNGSYSRAGWTVLRYWDFEIEKDLARVTLEIVAALRKRKQGTPA